MKKLIKMLAARDIDGELRKVGDNVDVECDVAEALVEYGAAEFVENYEDDPVKTPEENEEVAE